VIAHLIFYAIEGGVLACVAWSGLALGGNGLRRLGAPLRLPHLRVILLLWVVFAAFDAAFSEVIGPEFTLPYHLSAWLAVGGALVWLVSFIHRRALIDKGV
jgi:hypothetical protein